MSPLKIEFINRIREQLPQEAEAFLSAIDREARPSVRVNRSRSAELSVVGDGAVAVPWNADGFWLDKRPVYTLDPLFHAGCYYPQEASSMMLRQVLEAVEGLMPSEPVVLDLCAAPGGKSTLMASWLDGRGLLLANEYVRQRSWILRENVAKWGLGNCVVTNCDSARMGELGAMFDLVLIDAPCSGEGMFRKDDVARTEWSVENAAMCAERQKEIIGNVWDAVVEGGVVIYSTCTFNPEENERQMMWLASHYDVEFIDVPMKDDWGMTTIDSSGVRGYAFYPHKVDGEGFFVSVMRKLDGCPRKRIKPGKKDAFVEVKSMPEKMMPVSPSEYAVYQNGEQLYAFPRRQAQLVVYLAECLKAIWAGVPIGKQTRKELIPAEELALQVDYKEGCYPSVELTEEEALRYLRGEWTYQGDMPQGWCVAVYGGQRLGFVKVIGNRVNNYWPKEWRIRMDL